MRAGHFFRRRFIVALLLVFTETPQLAFCETSLPSAPPGFAGLIGYWPFDEGSGITSVDLSGNLNTVTLFNGVEWVPGKIGISALSFTAADHLARVKDTVIRQNSGMFNLLGYGPITITAWINPQAWSSYGNNRGDIIYSESSAFRVRGGSNNLEFTNDFFEATPNAASAVGSIELDRWTFVTVTRNVQGLVTFYIDGKISGPANQWASDIPQNYTDSYRGTCIGIKCHNMADTFNGHIDDLRVYNRVLTLSEISDSSNLPLVSITSPIDGPVSNAVTIIAAASDDTGIAGVQFKLDEVAIESEDTTSPYSVVWNTAGASTGAHTITASARDAAGNLTTSVPVLVTVANGATPKAPSNLRVVQ